ncbi:hypothetical protein ACFO1B_36305 [Dactylosporangium siamense]|uniref:Uncharacterized protein n=1 Tax=Dactylosporangium siamense TaxID=685454 RepID=A0A919PMQ2_9ACTN|nr:hypothetical protein [Dactylosporangium siamense]GIG46041.1 hypothetical protein Dsi01nite_040820 [Dactylosporangium siamense]
MGASGWDYLVPYDGGVEAALKRLRAEVFASGDYYWTYGEDRPKPATEEELWADHNVRESMTHSVLDIFEVGTGDPWGGRTFGKTFEVTEAECTAVFGTPRPTADDLGSDLEEPTQQLLAERGVGRHLIIHGADGPAQILFFGATGD